MPSPGDRDKTAVGVFSPTAAAIFIVTGAGLFYYFNSEKEALKKKKEEELATKAYGRPQIGGPFSLLTHENKPFTEKDLLGKWSLIYFGFTNCPDICPEELDKMGGAVTALEKRYGTSIQPVFISVDPPRDSPARIAAYLSEFHPRLIGLTGSYQDTKSVCKAYRVYFSTPPSAKADDDYLVDHSIFFYFMDPNGQFVDEFGKDTSMQDVVSRVQKEIGEWEKDGRWKA